MNNIYESNKSEKPALYRAGPIRGIKEFIPRVFGTKHLDIFKNKPFIYVTSDISFAAGFCFGWSNDEGFHFSKDNKYQPWTLIVPKKFRNRLLNKCSMYKVDNSSFIKIPKITTPEYICPSPVKVIEEYQFNSCLLCLKEYNVRLKVI